MWNNKIRRRSHSINKTGQGEEGNEDNENKILIFKEMVFECFF
jgi:hypothetical protein